MTTYHIKDADLEVVIAVAKSRLRSLEFDYEDPDSEGYDDGGVWQDMQELQALIGRLEASKSWPCKNPGNWKYGEGVYL